MPWTLIIAEDDEHLRSSLASDLQELLPGDVRIEDAPTVDDAFRRIDVASRDARGLAACATIHPDPSGAPGAWQLRAVATRADVRGAGHGRAVVEACLAHAWAREARLVWCHGRVGARGFYERLGFRAVSDVYEVPVSGPHVRMERAR